jgi:hypothetical protein
MLRDILNYLEKCIIQLEAVSWRNSILSEDKEYIRILDVKLKESDKSGDKALESIINRVKEEVNKWG